MNPCQPVTERFFLLIFCSQIPGMFFFVFLWMFGLRISKTTDGKNIIINGLAGAHRTRVHTISVYLRKTAWTFGFLCGKHVKFAWLPCNYLVSALGSTLGVKHDLILSLRSQIFERLRETFRHALEYLQLARSEKNEKNARFLQKHLIIIDLFEGLWSVGTRFRH